MITVVKIGGNVVDNPEALERFADNFAQLEGRKILIHGGGKVATRLCERLGIPTQMIDGRRVTSPETLEVVTMVYAGTINKRVVALLQSRGCNAIGLSGADGNVITATRRPAKPVDYGYVGDIAVEGVDAAMFAKLLDTGLTPTVCSVMHDGNATLLNCNADSVASAIAKALSRVEPTRLVFCFEKDGVMRDVDDPTSLIETIDSLKFNQLRSEGVINKGMIPKVENAIAAVESGVASVIIKHSDNLLVDRGTVITL